MDRDGLPGLLQAEDGQKEQASPAWPRSSTARAEVSRASASATADGPITAPSSQVETAATAAQANHQGNPRVPVGAPLSHLLTFCTVTPSQSGGRMDDIGFVSREDVPVVVVMMCADGVAVQRGWIDHAVRRLSHLGPDASSAPDTLIHGALTLVATRVIADALTLSVLEDLRRLVCAFEAASPRHQAGLVIQHYYFHSLTAPMEANSA